LSSIYDIPSAIPLDHHRQGRPAQVRRQRRPEALPGLGDRIELHPLQIPQNSRLPAASTAAHQVFATVIVKLDRSTLAAISQLIWAGRLAV
jgi:hypothetical protein